MSRTATPLSCAGAIHAYAVYIADWCNLPASRTLGCVTADMQRTHSNSAAAKHLELCPAEPLPPPTVRMPHRVPLPARACRAGHHIINNSVVDNLPPIAGCGDVVLAEQHYAARSTDAESTREANCTAIGVSIEPSRVLNAGLGLFARKTLGCSIYMTERAPLPHAVHCSSRVSTTRIASHGCSLSDAGGPMQSCVR
jgi:hypothetical protein